MAKSSNKQFRFLASINLLFGRLAGRFVSYAKRCKIDRLQTSDRVVLTALVVGILVFTSGCKEQTKRGFIERDFVDSDGEAYHYLIYVPNDYQHGEHRPTILFMNGLGENGHDGLFAISNNFGVQIWEMKRAFPFICIIPQCRKGEEWSEVTIGRAMRFADEVTTEFQTDKDRFYLTGVSTGGRGAWRAIQMFPDKIAAALLLCGKPDIDPKSIAESRVPIWNHCNARDNEEFVAANRKIRTDLLLAGASPLYTEYNQNAHNCWDRVYRSPFVYQWLLEQSISARNMDRPIYQLIAPETVVQDWERLGDSVWQVDDQSIVPVEPRDSDLDALVCDQASTNFEFHVDGYFTAPATGLRIGLFSEADELKPESKLIEVCIQLPEQGDSGFRSKHGNWLAVAEPRAARQLVEGNRNDLRVELRDGILSLRINGAKAIAKALDELGIESGLKISPGIIATSNSRWENIRVQMGER